MSKMEEVRDLSEITPHAPAKMSITYDSGSNWEDKLGETYVYDAEKSVWRKREMP